MSDHSHHPEPAARRCRYRTPRLPHGRRDGHHPLMPAPPGPGAAATSRWRASGADYTLRPADERDLESARALHERCSRRTLALRYHGPVADADRYLRHLLSPRFGRTLAAETASGRMVGLGHLLWDGDEAEVALLIEDGRQNRGLGTGLLRRLAGLAAEARCTHLYAVTQGPSGPMTALMRGLGLPLDHRAEEGTVVLTARLAPEGTPAAACPPRTAPAPAAPPAAGPARGARPGAS